MGFGIICGFCHRMGYWNVAPTNKRALLSFNLYYVKLFLVVKVDKNNSLVCFI